MGALYTNAGKFITNKINETRTAIDTLLLAEGISAMTIVAVHNQLTKLEVKLRSKIQYTNWNGIEDEQSE